MNSASPANNPVKSRHGGMIIVFDSGIGGFSILREIIAQHLAAPILYLGDQANFPYGSKDNSWLTSRLQVIARWASTQKPEAFVIACNTGTVAGIQAVRNILSCPVIGVEPVIKPLASYPSALILSTQVTADSLRTQELLNTHGSHLKLYVPKLLATAIENNDSTQVKKELDQISEIVQREKIAAIGLSCTHYPLITDQLKSRFPDLTIFDPSAAVVKQLNSVLSLPASADAPGLTFLTTGAVVRLKEQVSQYLGGHYPTKHLNL